MHDPNLVPYGTRHLSHVVAPRHFLVGRNVHTSFPRKTAHDDRCRTFGATLYPATSSR